MTIDEHRQALREASTEQDLLAVDMDHEHAEPLCVYSGRQRSDSDYRYRTFNDGLANFHSPCKFCFEAVDPIPGETIVKVTSRNVALHLPLSYRGVPGVAGGEDDAE